MYSLDQLRRGIRNPNQVLRELNKLYWSRGYRREYNPDGTDILEEDWDNLIILDGCRFDALADQLSEYDIEGDLQQRTSRGSATWQFLRGNFHNKQLDDVVYVTASTILYQGSVFRDDLDVELHDVVDVWTGGIEYGGDGTPPENVAEKARETNDEYPNKRLIMHFVQPHAPYLGDLGKEHFPDFRPNPLSERFRGLIDTPEETLRSIYRENLDLVLEEVEELLSELTGKTVITADHGMLLGERERPFPVKSYGHPSRVYVDEMVTVPWLVIDGQPRKQIVAGAAGDEYSKKRTDQLDEKARDHLEQMGYL